MKPNSFAFAVKIVALMLFAVCLHAQSPPVAEGGEGHPPEQTITLQAGTALTLVDVIAETTPGKLRTRHLLTELQQSDFQLFDNDKQVEIKNFDARGNNTRPIALWLVVQCHQKIPPEWGSGFMRDKVKYLQPALAALHPDDVIGVAHWCDDGTEKVDLAPSANGEAALRMVNTLLEAKAVEGIKRQGELALQQLFTDVLASTGELSPKRLPVFLFMYGDHSATYPDEAAAIVRSLLESSGVVFGMVDQNAEVNLSERYGVAEQVAHLIHQYAIETGGQYLAVDQAEKFASALAYIITEVHLRYVLSFKPPSLDGKRHTLRVQLTTEASRRFGNPDLRFRTEYIPLPHSARK